MSLPRGCRLQTIAFGRMYDRMQREWCDYCIRELEALQRMKNGREQQLPAAETQEEAK